MDKKRTGLVENVHNISPILLKRDSIVVSIGKLLIKKGKKRENKNLYQEASILNKHIN